MFEIGASLREARTRQGFDLDEMEQRTKVRSKYLRYLEEERFDQLPGHTYTKGFLRAYADSLGLEGQLYVDEYNSRFVVGEDEPSARARRVQPVRHRRQQRRESRLVVGVVAVIALVTALVIAAWRFGGTESPSVTGLRAPRADATVETAVQRVTLEVRAVRGPSYMEVWHDSPTGEQLYAGTLERGRVQRFVDTSLYLSVAKPRNVVVKINGNRYAPFDGELDLSAATAVRG